MGETTFEKRYAALVQLETALRLFDEGQDLISVITLAGAAEEMFGQLLRERGDCSELDSHIEAARAIYSNLFKEQVGAKVFADRANRARNLLKHHTPGQASTVTIDLFEEATDMLDRAVSNYWQLEETLTEAMRLFTVRQRSS